MTSDPNSNRRKSRSLLGAAVIVCAGCGAAEHDDGATSAQEPIIGGQNVAVDTIGTPCLYGCTIGTGICTGTMLTSNWMLTAKHCVNVENTTTGMTKRTDVTAHLMGVATQSKAAEMVLHPALDVALVRFNPAPLDASGHTVLGNRLYRGSSAGLVNKLLPVQGWGINQLTSCAPFTGIGEGTLRSGTIQVVLEASSGFFGNPWGGQIPSKGDSGSSPFSTVLNRKRPSGVLSAAHCIDTPGFPHESDVTYVGADAFRDWANGIVGAAPTFASTMGYERSDGVSSLVYTFGNRVKELALANNHWSLLDLTTASGGPTAQGLISAYVRADSVNAVVYRDFNLHVREIALTPNGWLNSDLSQMTGAPGASVDPAAYTRGDGVSIVVYMDTSGHVQELSLGRRASSWQRSDLTAILGAPLAQGAFPPIGYVREDGISAVVYGGRDSHVREMALTASGWRLTDLTAITGAPIVQATIRPFTRPDGNTSIQYIDGARHIQDLSLAGGIWRANDLSAIVGIPPARYLSPYVRADGVTAIIFQSLQDNHVRELSLSGGWHVTDLTANAGAPDAAPSRIASGYVRADATNNVVYQADANNHIIALSQSSVPGQWVWNDLSAIVGGP